MLTCYDGTLCRPGVCSEYDSCCSLLDVSKQAADDRRSGRGRLGKLKPTRRGSQVVVAESIGEADRGDDRGEARVSELLCMQALERSSPLAEGKEARAEGRHSLETRRRRFRCRHDRRQKEVEKIGGEGVEVCVWGGVLGWCVTVSVEVWATGTR